MKKRFISVLRWLSSAPLGLHFYYHDSFTWKSHTFSAKHLVGSQANGAQVDPVRFWNDRFMTNGRAKNWINGSCFSFSTSLCVSLEHYPVWSRDLYCKQDYHSKNFTSRMQHIKWMIILSWCLSLHQTKSLLSLNLSIKRIKYNSLLDFPQLNRFIKDPVQFILDS